MFMYSCKEKENVETPIDSEELVDVIPPKLLEAIESLPIVDFELEDIILPNGLKYNDFDVDLFGNSQKSSSLRATTADVYPKISPIDAKNQIVKLLSGSATVLTKREWFQYPYEGENKPAQNGLAFVYGSKDIKERYRYAWGVWPLDYKPCPDKLYGLDCSGYIYQVFNRSAIPITTVPESKISADVLRQTTTIESALKSAIPNLPKIKVENMGQLPPSQWEAGDIVYWKGDATGVAGHIGMFIQTSEGLNLANSSGDIHAKDCENNKSINGGPVKRSLAYAADKLTNPENAPWGYGIVRITVVDAWTLLLRCSNQNYDILNTVISISQTENFNDEFSVTCADYDGSPLHLVFKVQYDKNTTILNLTMTVLEDGRTDAAQIKLDTDDSGYVNLQKVVDNGGCYGQVRLIKGSHSNSLKSAKSNDLKNNNNGCTIRGIR